MHLVGRYCYKALLKTTPTKLQPIEDYLKDKVSDDLIQKFVSMNNFLMNVVQRSISGAVTELLPVIFPEEKDYNWIDSKELATYINAKSDFLFYVSHVNSIALHILNTHEMITNENEITELTNTIENNKIELSKKVNSCRKLQDINKTLQKEIEELKARSQIVPEQYREQFLALQEEVVRLRIQNCKQASKLDNLLNPIQEDEVVNEAEQTEIVEEVIAEGDNLPMDNTTPIDSILNLLNSLNITVIGGGSVLSKVVKRILPNATWIPVGRKHNDYRVGPSTDLIVVYTPYIDHSTTYYMRNEAKKYGVTMAYVSATPNNTEEFLRQIYKYLKVEDLKLAL